MKLKNQDNKNNEKELSKIRDLDLKKEGYSRRFRRFFRKRKVFQARQQILEFQQFSAIFVVASVGGSSNSASSKHNSWLALFNIMTHAAASLYQKAKLSSGRAMTSILKHPDYVRSAVFASLSLLILYYANKKMTETKYELKKWMRISLLFFALIASASLLVLWDHLIAFLGSEFVRAFRRWLHRILLGIVSNIRDYHTILYESRKQTQNLPSLDPALTSKPQLPKPDNGDNWFTKTICFFIFTLLVNKAILDYHARRLARDLPFPDLAYKFIEIDLSDLLPHNWDKLFR